MRRTQYDRLSQQQLGFVLKLNTVRECCELRTNARILVALTKYLVTPVR